MTAARRDPAVALLLPPDDLEPVREELSLGGFEPVPVGNVRELDTLLASRHDVVVAVIDADCDEEAAREARVPGPIARTIPALIVVSPATLDHLDAQAGGHDDDEYQTRPYSAASIRWRVEAMCIRSVAVDDGSGPVLQSPIESSDWAPRGRLLAVFNPKGGVGKTTVAMNLAAALTLKGSQVLLLDADTVTGHVVTSLGLDAVLTVADAWRDELDGGPVLGFAELAASHPSGLRALALASSPIHTEILEPGRVAAAISVARRGVDYVIVDLHPSYGALNRAIFDRADRILVPVTPDLPAIRAAVQLREVADELGMRDRLAIVVNRANSGVASEDLERALGMPAFAAIRSAGLVLVRAANEGRTVVEMAPREKIAQDFLALADRVLGAPEPEPPRAAFRLLGRAVAARA